MKIIILNLPRSIAEDEMAELFKVYGPVASAHLVMDDQTSMSKGFGFVEMEDETLAKAAIEGLHGKKVGAMKVRVKPFEARQ